ncbi:hypothetical protein U1769_01380 [Sphingomonas sp. ZT3P38]
MTPAEFKSRFVVGLGGAARSQIWERLKTSVLDEIVKLNIPCELWIDGSYITLCPEPDDIDGSLMVLSEVIDNLDQDGITYLNKFDDYEPWFHKSLDIFLCQVYPVGNPLRGDMNDPDGWAKQWSSERNSGWLKGFVVIPFR